MISYLNERKSDRLMCMYLFNATTSLSCESFSKQCPFGSLILTAKHTRTLSPKVGIALDNTTLVNDVQVVGSEPVKAKDFYTDAVGHGMTFEFVLRINQDRSHANVNIFAINSPFDDCTNSGFRLELSDKQILVFIFYTLQPTNGVLVCYEQSFYSVSDNDGPCQVPLATLVHTFVSLTPLDGASWTTNFLISYHDTDGNYHSCFASSSMGGSSAAADFTRVNGAYKLYLGNNGRSPSNRNAHRLPRKFAIPGPATTQNQAVLALLTQGKDVLDMILPPSGGFFFALNGKKVVDVDKNGIAFGNNGTKYGLPQLKKLAEIAVAKLNDAEKMTRAKYFAAMNSSENVNNTTDIDWARHPPQMRYPPPNVSTSIEVYFFAISQIAMNASQLAERAKLPLPLVGMGLSSEIHIPQDSAKQLWLNQVTMNDPNAAVQLLSLPRLGTVTSCNNTAISVGQAIADRCIIFKPLPGQSNANMPLSNKYAILERQEPYATIRFGLLNGSCNASIDVFVDAVEVKIEPSPVLILAPPYTYFSSAKYHELAHFTFSVESTLPDEGTIFRVIVESALMGGRLNTTNDNLLSTSARSYCPFDKHLNALCLARDNGSTGVTFELLGVNQDPTRLVFRGTLTQISNALTNISLNNWRHEPHNATISLKIQALSNTSTIEPLDHKITIHFTHEDPSNTMSCTNLLGIIPLCSESFSNGSVLASMIALGIASLICKSKKRKVAQQVKKLRAMYMVANEDEFNGILDQLLRVLLEPNLQAATVLWELSRGRMEQQLCMETLSLALSFNQMMPIFLGKLWSNAMVEEVDALMSFTHFYFKLMGQSWICLVLQEILIQRDNCTIVLWHNIVQYIDALPVEIVLLTEAIAKELKPSRPAEVFMDLLVRPACRSLDLAVDYRVPEEVHQAFARRSHEFYAPESREANFCVLHGELMEDLLFHLHCLCAHHVDMMAEVLNIPLDEETPAVGSRIQEIILALGPPVIDLNTLIRLTQDGPQLSI